MAAMTDELDESISVNPGDPEAKPHTKDAGHDESIAERLERNPENKEARLDRALDESMDASDPPSGTQPVHNHQPAPSSGYDEEAERQRQRQQDS